MIYRAFPPDAAGDGDAAFDLALATWESVRRSFAPLIGEFSVRMIFARALDLVRPAYPWLERASLSQEGEGLQFLRERMHTREVDEAMDACRTLLLAFCDILDALIGSHLTSRAIDAALGQLPPVSERADNPDAVPADPAGKESTHGG